MGAAASVPDSVDEAKAKELAGAKFDAGAFAAAADDGGRVTKAAALEWATSQGLVPDVPSFFGKPIEDVYYQPTLDSLPDLSGKCYAITGCTSGTGLWTAIAAVRKGAACVIMLNRKSSRAETAEAKVKAEVKGDTKIVTVECDLQSFENTAAAAKAASAIAADYGGLDVLVNNAGVMGVPDTRTVDGFEVQMQTNHLAHFLLWKLLKPSLEAAAEARGEARITQHSSGARSGARATTPADGNLGPEFMSACEPGTLGGDAIPECFNRYHQTKLANPVFMMALHDQLTKEGSKIKSICAEPGVAQTDLAANLVNGHNQAGNGEKILPVMENMAAKYSGLQSCADGACALMMAAFATDVSSGDFCESG